MAIANSSYKDRAIYHPAGLQKLRGMLAVMRHIQRTRSSGTRSQFPSDFLDVELLSGRISAPFLGLQLCGLLGEDVVGRSSVRDGSLLPRHPARLVSLVDGWTCNQLNLTLRHAHGVALGADAGPFRDLEPGNQANMLSRVVHLEIRPHARTPTPDGRRLAGSTWFPECRACILVGGFCLRISWPAGWDRRCSWRLCSALAVLAVFDRVVEDYEVTVGGDCPSSTTRCR